MLSNSGVARVYILTWLLKKACKANDCRKFWTSSYSSEISSGGLFFFFFFVFFSSFNAAVKKSPTSLTANIKGNLTYRTRDILTQQLHTQV